MDNKEVINWLTRIRDRLMTTSSKQFEAMTIAITALEKQEQSCDTCKHRNEHFSCKRCGDCSVGYPDRYEAESNFEATPKNFEPCTEEES